MPETREEILGYELIVDVSGPGVRDRIEVQGKSPEELEPEVIEIEGYRFQRYAGEQGEYVDIRHDYVVSRRMIAIVRRTPPIERDIAAPPEAGDSRVSGPQAEERQQ